MVLGDRGIGRCFIRTTGRRVITKKPIRIAFHTGALAIGYNMTNRTSSWPEASPGVGGEMANGVTPRRHGMCSFGLRLGGKPRQIVTRRRGLFLSRHG